MQRREAFDEARVDAVRLVRIAALDHDRLLEEAMQLLSVLAEVPEVRGGDPAACSRFLARLRHEHSRYTNLGVIERDGDISCSAIPLRGRVNVADHIHFQRAIETRDFAVGDYRIDRISRRAVLDFGYPILDANDRVRSVVFAALDLGWLYHFAAQAALPPLGTLLVVDHAGTILVRYPGSARAVGRTISEAPLLTAIRAARGSGTAMAAGPDGIVRIFAFTRLPTAPEGGEIYVAVGIPRVVAYAEFRRALVGNLALEGVVTVLGLLAAWVGGTIFLRRMRRLAQAAERLGAGDLSARAELPYGPGEIEQLARAFDEMAATLQRRAEEARAEARRHAFLAEAAEVLSSSLDYETTLRTVARIAVPTLADYCLVDVVMEDGTIRRLATAHADPAKEPLVRELQRFPPDPTGRRGVARVLRTGEPVLIPEAPPFFPEEVALNPEHLRIIRELGVKSVMIVPIVARGQVLGAITFVTSESGRSYSPDDLALAWDLAHHAGLAIDNARLYRESQAAGRDTDRTRHRP